jgi:hypothetical protein
MSQSERRGMRYPRHDERVNVLLDLARAAYAVEKSFERADSADFLQHIDNYAVDFAWSFIEIIMEHEKRERRHAEFWSKWKRWRNKRESIKRIAQPNAVFLGRGLPPAAKRKRPAKR